MIIETHNTSELWGWNQRDIGWSYHVVSVMKTDPALCCSVNADPVNLAQVKSLTKRFPTLSCYDDGFVEDAIFVVKWDSFSGSPRMWAITNKIQPKGRPFSESWFSRNWNFTPHKLNHSIIIAHFCLCMCEYKVTFLCYTLPKIDIVSQKTCIAFVTNRAKFSRFCSVCATLAEVFYAWTMIILKPWNFLALAHSALMSESSLINVSSIYLILLLERATPNHHLNKSMTFISFNKLGSEFPD